MVDQCGAPHGAPQMRNRNKEIKIRLSDAELALAQRKAILAGFLTVHRYAQAFLLGTLPQDLPPVKLDPPGVARARALNRRENS